jgi:hypothetical protein
LDQKRLISCGPKRLLSTQRSDPSFLICTILLQNEDQKDLVLRGLELRKRLPEYFRDRHDVLVKALPSFVPNVLRNKMIKLVDESKLSTDEMWGTGLGNMSPQRQSELFTFLETDV